MAAIMQLLLGRKAAAHKSKQTVNDRMFVQLFADYRALDWTIREWSRRLRCHHSTVQKSDAWYVITQIREIREKNKGG